MKLSERVKRVLLFMTAAAALFCAAVTFIILFAPREETVVETFLTPRRVSLPSSSLSSSSSSEEQLSEDQWPKVPVPERDPSYRPKRPAWLTADLTETTPVPGKVAYLTFDDGPSSMTPQVLDVLRKKGATATFFTVHNANPDCLAYYQEIVDSGCELALHAYEHNLPKIYKTPESYLNDYNTMNDFLYEAAGVRTKQVRFPGGSSQTMTNRGVFWQVMEAAQEEGLIWHDWNVSSGDASPTPHTDEWIYNNIFPAALRYDNPVILMHDVPRNTYTLEALPWIIDTLRANGYRLDVISNIKEPVQHRNPDRDEPPRKTGGGQSSSSSTSSAAVSSSQPSAPEGASSVPERSDSSSAPPVSSLPESSVSSSAGSISSSEESGSSLPSNSSAVSEADHSGSVSQNKRED